MSKPYIHLHVHTEYSMLDGAAKIDKLVQAAKASGAPAIGLTDHGNMYGTIKLYDACKNAGIKPVLGCEFYTTSDMTVKEHMINGRKARLNHLVLLAKNNIGFDNISKMCSLAWTEGFYHKPRIDLALLKKHSEGIICLSACLAGVIPQMLLNNDYEGAKNYAIELRDMFDEGDFYIELQNHGIEEQLQTNPLLVKIAREIGVKCVATNDVHYIKKSDADMHDIMLCMQTGSYYDDPERMRFSCEEFYYKSTDEMREVLGWCEESLETPYEIADKCDVNFVFNEYQLPEYHCPDNLTPPEYLRQLAYEGLERRYGSIPDEYIERAETELNVIISMGFSEYYLIVWDFINWSRLHDIPVGPGRGSGVGSIVAYSIGITNVDPMRYGLIFERFLNINRTSMPDFDIDFCYSRRGEVIQYVKDKYGDDHISQIITFGKLKRKAVIKDVARVFKLPFNEVNKVTSHIAGAYENDKKVHVDNLIDPMHPCAVPELIECYNNSPTWKRALDLAVQLEGMPKSNGMHAAGVVIYKKPAVDTIPLAKNGDEVTTQFDMSEVERLGLLKMDFLALMTLTDIKMAHDYVQKRTGIDIDFEKIGHDDLAVFDLIGSGSTDAIFQLEGGGMKKFMARFRPKNIEEIIAGISLYRPGPMANIDTFLNNRKFPDKIQYAHPKLKEILSVTYGIMVYQEQAMAITRAIAGYDMTMADKFRAIISKKKVHLIEDERNMFIHGRIDKDGKIIVPGSVRNGVSEDTARAIFAQMEAFASYAFNKSHAAAYAMISYETAFYKKYYPVEFLASVLNNRIGKATETAKYMQVLKNENIPLLQPDINRSDTAFSPDETSIRYGLSCIKNVGKQAIDKIIAEREKDGNFTDLFDFIDRCGSFVNKRMIESLIYGGAFDCFNMTRATMIANYEEIIAFVDRKHKNDNSNQMDFFSMLSEEDEEKYEFHLHKEYGVRDRLAAEKDVLGMYVTGHPLDGYEKDFDLFNFTTKMLPEKADDDDLDGEEDNNYGTFTEEENPYNLQDGMDIYTGGLLSDVTIKRTKDGKEMAICVLEDYHGRIEAIAFSRTLQQCKAVIEKDALVRIKGRLSIQGEAKITIQSVQPWALEDKLDTQFSVSPIANDTRTLYINLIANDKRIWDKISKVLSAYEGESIVKVQINKQLYQHPLKIKNLDQVARELIGIVGSQNIKIK